MRKPKCLTKVKMKGGKLMGVIITGPVQKSYIKDHSHLGTPPYTVVDEAGRGYSFDSAAPLWMAWEKVPDNG